MSRLFILTATAAVLAACSPQEPAVEKAALQVKYNTDLPMNELMGHVIDPAAWTYWRASGTEVTAKGERDLSPTRDEDWIPVENAAALLVEAGNLLQLPGRTQAPEADWNRYAQQLTERAMAARMAAEKRDKQGVFDEGGRVYEACVACHEKFIIEPEVNSEGGAAVASLPALPQEVAKKASGKP